MLPSTPNPLFVQGLPGCMSACIHHCICMCFFCMHASIQGPAKTECFRGIRMIGSTRHCRPWYLTYHTHFSSSHVHPQPSSVNPFGCQHHHTFSHAHRSSCRATFLFAVSGSRLSSLCASPQFNPREPDMDAASRQPLEEDMDYWSTLTILLNIYTHKANMQLLSIQPLHSLETMHKNTVQHCMHCSTFSLCAETKQGYNITTACPCSLTR